MKSTLGRVVLAAVVLGGFVFLGLFHEALDSPDRVRAYGGATGSWSRPKADWEKRNPIGREQSRPSGISTNSEEEKR